MEEEKKGPSRRESTASDPRRKSTTQSSANQSVLQIFSEAVIQRRQHSFDRLRDWDQKRAQRINDYRTVCESIIRQLEQRTEVSAHSFESVLKFFSDRKRQEELYVQTMTKGLPNLTELFQDKGLKPPHTWTLPTILKNCDDFHQVQCKASQDIATFIDQKILKGLAESQKTLIKLQQSNKETLTEGRKEMNNINAKMKKKAQKYASLVTDLMKSASSSKKKDPYNKELAMLACAQKQMQEHQKFGKQVVSMWENVHKTELARYQALKSVAVLYLKKMEELYGKNFAHPEVPLKSFEAFKPDEEVARIYNINAIVEAGDAKIIKDDLGAQQLNFKLVKDYLTEIVLVKPETQPLVLKEWSAKREGGILKSMKACTVAITVDGNLLLIDRTDGNVIKKADNVIKLERIKVNVKKETEVEIVETKPGILLDSSTKYHLKFDSVDSVEELLHHIRNTRG